MDIMKHGEETAEEIEAAFVGVNNGVAALSECRRTRPTLISGTGRSGTTALARCFLNSDDVKFVTQDETDGSNLEVAELNKALAAHDKVAWAEFIRKSSEEVAHDFVFKNPRFEIHALREDSDDFSEVLRDCNVIVMTRDPFLVATREWSIHARRNAEEKGRTFGDHVRKCCAVLGLSMKGAIELSKSMGVLLVSYEKLITQPQQVADEINVWFGRERLTKKAIPKSIMPNNPYYLERQTLGWMRQMKDMKERRARGER